jgi:hypothetical protein
MGSTSCFGALGSALLFLSIGAVACSGSSNTAAAAGDDASTSGTPDAGVSAPSGACSSDKECVANGQLCDTARGLCVDCLDTSGCKTNQSCEKGKCVDFMPCMSSLDCAVGSVCDKTKMRCVECLTQADCPAGKMCGGNTCRSACASDKDCTGGGQLCDTMLGYCVGCLADTDCKNGYCDMAQCVPQSCTPGAVTCLPAGASTCSTRGDSFGAPISCGDQMCVAGVGCGGEGGAVTPMPDGGVTTPPADAGSEAGFVQLACNLNDLSIVDDMEDGSALQIPALAGRVGHWLTFNDGSAGSDTLAFPTTTYPQGGTHSLRFYGGGFSVFGAGAELVLTGTTSTYYDVKSHGYNGLQFWARATAPTSFRVNIADSTSDPAGGVCSGVTGCVTNCCYDHYGVDMTLSTDWKLYRIRFDQLYRVNLNGPGTPFDPTKVFHIDLRTFLGTFDVYVDDIAFITCE